MALARPKQIPVEAHMELNHEATDAAGTNTCSPPLGGARTNREDR
jgi:hypothetical protein